MSIVAVSAAVCVSCVANSPLRNGDRLEGGTGSLTVQARGGEGPVKIVDDDFVRITVAPGDQWDHDDRRGKNNERAELSSSTKVPFGSAAVADVDMRFFPTGEHRPGRWTTVLQLHGPNRNVLKEGSAFGPPVLSFQLKDDNVVVTARGGNGHEGVLHRQTIGSFPADFESWHSYRVEVVLGERGVVSVSRDGVPLLHWNGAVGYAAGDLQHYWKMGIYRSPGWTQAAQIDLRIDCVGSSEDCET